MKKPTDQIHSRGITANCEIAQILVAFNPISTSRMREAGSCAQNVADLKVGHIGTELEDKLSSGFKDDDAVS